MAAKIGGLGKGLDALFAENAVEDKGKAVSLRISEIEPNQAQPRKQFDDGNLADLAASIAQHGVLQPLLVRPMADGSYQLVAGERRWRAARMAGLSEVPVVVRELTDRETAELALIENLQRQDLNPMEEAYGYRALMEQYGLTQDEVAKAVNKSRPAVANALRLLNLPSELATMVQHGALSAGHARTLLSFETPQAQLAAAKLAIDKELSVRALEKMAKEAQKEQKDKPRSERRDSLFDEVELALTENLGRKVRVVNRGENGVLQIEFYGKDDLQALANIVAVQE